MQVVWLKCRQGLVFQQLASGPVRPCLPSGQSVPQHGAHMLLMAPEVLQPTP